MTAYSRRHIMMLGAGLAVAGCSLPRSAARESEIINSAARADTPSDYAIYRVTRAFVPKVEHWPMTGSGPRGGWISRGRPPARPRIAPGDHVDLVIWDNETNSLLAVAGQKSVSLNDLLVAPDGGIFVPYLNHVIVSGLSIEEARKKIQDQMSSLSPSVQVQMQVKPGQRNSIELVGGVVKPGSYPLIDGGVSLLSLLSEAGGVPDGLNNPVVQLRRGGHSYFTTLARIYATPSFDTYLWGGDKVIIESDPRTFIALGAARSERQVQFTKDHVSALNAMADIGGVNPGRANPKGILILRQYKASQVVRTGHEPAAEDEPKLSEISSRGPGAQQAIFVLDLTTADGLFAAGQFQVHPDDLIYVSESALTTVQTISGILGTILGLGQRSSSLANSTSK